MPAANLPPPRLPAPEVYRAADLRDWTQATAGIDPPLKLAVFGDPVAHSASPPMQNAALASCGIHLRYTRVHVRPGELAAAIAHAAEHGFVGVNLTIPHKEPTFSLVDFLDASAVRMGVVNTIRFERTTDGVRSRGFNTDGPGFERALVADLGCRLGGTRVMLLGAGGGAGRAIARQCVEAGCRRLLLVNRTSGKAEALAGELRLVGGAVAAVSWEPAELREAAMDVDLIVNASAVGLAEHDASPLPAGDIPGHVRVFDTVYRSDGSPTALEIAAREAGAQTTGGRSLLLYQGALSFEHWFGRSAPIAEMRQALTL